MNRAAIITEAPKWEGTPFAHYQCCCQVGVDCAHLIIGVGKNVGLLPFDFKVPFYSQQWMLYNQELLLKTLQERGFRKKETYGIPGDVAVINIGDVACHTGILLPDCKFIHARFSRTSQKVTISRLMNSHHIVAYYAYPGIKD